MIVQTRIPASEIAPVPPLTLERPEDAAAIETLVAAAFGPGRFAKAAERLRETNHVLYDLSVTAWSGGALAGCVRQWPIRVAGRPVVFLGPIAVDPAWRHHGLGGALVERCCEAARLAGHDVILLVGDLPFFGPHGFATVPAGRVILPGPVAAHRVLARALTPGATDDLAGRVVPGW